MNEDICSSLVDICPKCKEISGNNNTIGCDGLCQEWFHYSCAGLSRSEFERLSCSEESWVCKDWRVLRQQKQDNDMQGTFDSNEKPEYNDPYPIFIPITKKIKNCSKAKWGNIEGISNISKKIKCML